MKPVETLIGNMKRRADELRTIIKNAERWTAMPKIMAERLQSHIEELGLIGPVLEHEQTLLQLSDDIAQGTTLDIAMTICELTLLEPSTAGQAKLNELVLNAIQSCDGLRVKLLKMFGRELTHTLLRFGTHQQIADIRANLLGAKPNMTWLTAPVAQSNTTESSSAQQAA